DEVDVVAFTGDLPDGGAELARALEPGVVFGRADLRQFAPAVEVLAVDDAASAELHEEIALVLLRHDADGIGSRRRAQLHGHGAESARGAPDEHVMARAQHVWAVTEQHAVSGGE